MPATPRPLVLLSGMNCSSRLWHPVLARLRDVDPLALEISSPTLDGCVADVLESAPERFALAGLSLGGIVAMAVLRRAPERVTRLALLDTTARPPTRKQRAEWAATRVALGDGATARQIQQALLPVLLSEQGRRSGLDDAVLALADETGEDRLDAQLSAQQTRIDERPGLRVRVPTLVIAGARDALCGVQRHQEMAALVPGSRLELLAGVGHLSAVEAPRDVARLLHGWLG